MGAEARSRAGAPLRAPGTVASPPPAGAALGLVGSAFFVSGTAGLVYQVVWQRILALHTGIGIYSVAMIVASFMAGLGIGSHLGGTLSERVTRRRALALFGILELGIGLFGASSCWLYHDILYDKLGWLYASTSTAGILHFLGLVVPTTLMGMTLPFLTRAMVRQAGSAGRTVGLLYAVNMLGASLGAGLTPWVLIRLHGLRGAALFAAGCNIMAALVALTVARRQEEPSDDVDAAPATTSRDPAEPERHPFLLWMVLYALSGCCALSLEILWFRLLDLAVKSSAFTFGTLLSLYLLGTALGCVLGIPLASRLRRPLRTFLLCQCILLAYAGLVLVLLGRLPTGLALVRALMEYWRQGQGFYLGTEQDLFRFLGLYVLLPLVVFGLPTLLMGLSFPALQRAVHDDVRTSGRKVGLLQAANIAGCVSGSLLVGLLTLTWVGTTGTLRLLLFCGLVFAAVGLLTAGSRTPFAALAALTATIAYLVPDQATLWSRLHGTEDPRALVEEDATAVSAVVPSPDRWDVFVNGKGHSWVPFSGIHSQLGAVPAIVHAAPANVAIIGLGSGNTAWAAACRRETLSVTVFEIAAPLPRLLRRLAEREGFDSLSRLFRDPRVELRIADGRHAVTRGESTYDVIQADALWPHVAGSGNLYSTEFFSACARHLKAGGLVCTWSPTRRVYASFIRVFPHVLTDSGHVVLIGSNEPLPVAPQAWLARLQEPAVMEYLGSQAKTVAPLLVSLQEARRRRFRQSDLNDDLFPRDEFASP